MKLLPEVKKLETKEGYLLKNSIAPFVKDIDYRLKKVIDKLPASNDGAELIINVGTSSTEKYTLEIKENSVVITSDGPNGAFYALQTLRQIFKTSDKIPCLVIEDEPDFEYRGLYHDITRGKVPKLETIKKLIDDMAYFKMNSFQLYIEHTFEFKETKELIKKTGYISAEEIKELDEYCTDNFIDFIPSIATFGHMYEILEQEEFKHLRVCKDVKIPRNFWRARMRHHTVDPLNEESFELVKSLIDQTLPLYKTDKFNICCDETFDLENYSEGVDSGKLYLDFVEKIMSYVRSKGKKIMMWADIILKHPEILDSLPDDVYYLNWAYAKDPEEEKVIKLAESGKKQIVCPGTSTWSRFLENVTTEEGNITKLIDYGRKHGAVGVLNTNWGDYGNPASIELSMYGIVLGAAKSWRTSTAPSEELYEAVNALVYGAENAFQHLKRLSTAQSALANTWNGFCDKYFKERYGEEQLSNCLFETQYVPHVQKECLEIIQDVSKEKWENEEAREEMLLAAESVLVLSELGAKLYGVSVETYSDAEAWMKKYREKWLSKNKESELSRIEEMISYINAL